ncbi:MAG TPA: glycosyltransferase family 2 protein [Candidatus Paceibacterota bacterium]|nr:glycosyltransferase family 2 protein [Candidatus Paceibacterota bacterium]HRY76738.1 glycosyltransferase family 2 protein [Candidatus Paceibacterota bacterium]
MAKPYLSVIIPAYNESKSIAVTLFDIDKYLAQMDYSYEILVVNDGSKDNTAEIVDKLTPVIKNLVLIDNQQNKGKGGVIRQGMLEAKGTIRVFTDADNATSIDQINKLLPHFKEDYQVVIGSRAAEGAELAVRQPFWKFLLGRMGNLFIRLMVLPGVKDTQCGFKAFTEEAAEAVFLRTTIFGWGFDIEALAIAKLLGYRIKEVGIRWVNNPDSRVKPSSYLKVFLETIRIRVNLWWKKYGNGNRNSL